MLAVLLVDDDAGICSSLSRILRQDGYRVDIAHSAAEAIDRDHWNDYFAILLDRRLPDNSADDLLPRIIERAPDAAVIVVTGYADLESSLAAIRAGAADYLLKPVDPDDLRGRLRRFADLKEARDNVRRRDAQVAFMISHLPAGAAYVDNRTDEVRVNETVEAMTEYSASDLATRDLWFSHLLGSRADEFRQQYEVDRLEGFSKSRILPLKTRSGREISAEFSAYRYNDHEVWMIHDVTERLRVQEELRQQRDFSNRLLETAQVIVLVLDPAGHIVRFNQFTEELSGYTLESVRGVDWFETFPIEKERVQTKRLFQRVVCGEEVSGSLFSIQTRAGRERQIAWWAKSLKDGQGNVTEVLCIGHDVTALNDIQGKLVQSERLAAIGQMIAGLAHESRNALQRATATLDMLALDLSDQPQQVELTRRVQAAIQELQRLYEEVRGYAAPIRLSVGRCELADLWRVAWQHVMQAAPLAKVTLEEQIDVANLQCSADRFRIEQVFRNVLENAVAVSSPGSRVTIHCEEAAISEMPGLRITVTDQGPGMTTEQSSRVFEPFFTTKQKGTGLGMPISQRIVEAHGGTIRVSSNLPTGATIEIVLPRTPPTP